MENLEKDNEKGALQIARDKIVPAQKLIPGRDPPVRPLRFDLPLRGNPVSVDLRIAGRCFDPPQPLKSLQLAAKQMMVAGNTLRVVARNIEHVTPADHQTSNGNGSSPIFASKFRMPLGEWGDQRTVSNYWYHRRFGLIFTMGVLGSVAAYVKPRRMCRSCRDDAACAFQACQTWISTVWRPGASRPQRAMQSTRLNFRPCDSDMVPSGPPPKAPCEK